MVKDKHVISTLGKAEVVIEDGKITSIGEPRINYCPIYNDIDNVDEITKDYIEMNINRRIEEFGMCTSKRAIKMGDMMTFGISETLETNLELGTIDCVVGACEGVGTVLMTDPDTVQGVGGRVSGLVSTTPLPEVAEKLGRENVLNPETAELNQLEGVKKAIKKGYKNIAVTIIPCTMVKEIRELETPDDVDVYIFVAHTTGASKEEVVELFENADVITACASSEILDYADKVKPYYSGKKVPLFAATEKGREFLDNRLKAIGKPLTVKDYPLDRSNKPNPLV